MEEDEEGKLDDAAALLSDGPTDYSIVEEVQIKVDDKVKNLIGLRGVEKCNAMEHKILYTMTD